MPGIIIKPRARIFHGHDWVYSSEIKKTFGNPKPGDVISLKDFKDRSLGSAIYNPKSQIVARRFSRRKQDLNEDFFHSRINRAIKSRKANQSFDTSLSRLVWSESDGLPGLIVDNYKGNLIIQTLTLGMDKRINLICSALVSLLNPGSVTARNDSAIRVAEGLKLETQSLLGTPPSEIQIKHSGIPFSVNLLEGQKTGLYLDQLDNYLLVGKLAKNKNVLDCFTNQGGFALSCLLNGASKVTGVDISDSAVETAKKNSKILYKKNSYWINEKVFYFLKNHESRGDKYDMIILDPPSFTKNKTTLAGATRGYKEIHLR
ncbi:MAG: class I SAM-dependent rRNA methyltransferase, partial [Verrucomicrobiota bacterium]|nr:class I SAM-dependent rRNA methyltransferase [Verrucomicrobiota bacterium]